MKLLETTDGHDLFCVSCKAEPEAAVELTETSPGPQVCPACIFKAIGLLGVTVDCGPAQAFELMRLACGVKS